MLFTLPNHFNWQVDNFGTLGETFGTNVPGHANANEKGANTALLAGIAYDCYGIAIGFSGGNTTSVARRQLTDLLIDPAAGVGNAGSSWSVAIANLYSAGPTWGSNNEGVWYYFPLFIPAGSAIGAAHQDMAASTTALRMGVRLYGQPSRPDALNVGTQVQTLGVTLASTEGTAVTPGTSGAWGSYSSSLGTLTRASWWWQIGIGSADGTWNAETTMYDVACNATNKITCLQEVQFSVGGTAETSSKQAFGTVIPIQMIGAGQDVYVRGNCIQSASNTNMTAVVYALS
jgi:hypothetical protein